MAGGRTRWIGGGDGVVAMRRERDEREKCVRERRGPRPGDTSAEDVQWTVRWSRVQLYM